MRSSSGEELLGYEPHAPRERPKSQPAWPQPSGPQYGMPFAPWVSPMPMQPAMPPFMPMMPMPVPYLPPVTPQPQARGPSDCTTERENQRLRKKVRRLQDELTRTRCPGAMPLPKRLKVNIGRKVTEETQAEKQEDTIQRDPKWLTTSAPRPPQAPYKVQHGSLMVHLDEDVNVRPSQPYLNQQGAPLSSPQEPLRYGSYQPPTPPKPTEFQPLPPFPAPPALSLQDPSPQRSTHNHLPRGTVTVPTTSTAWIAPADNSCALIRAYVGRAETTAGDALATNPPTMARLK